MTKRGCVHLGIIILAFTIAYANFFCTEQTKSANTSPYLNHNDTVKYVGIETCRSCHGDIYNSFIETGMGKSFGVATRQKSAAQFGKNHVVYDANADFYYHPFWLNDSLHILEFRLSGKDTVYKRIEKVDYIIGSGQHTNSHLMNVNGYVYQLPLTWYAQKAKWDLPPGFENGRNTRFSREIGVECMSCHNAIPTVTRGSDNRFINIPKGIDCERCHGPGEVHVKEKLAGKLVDTATQIDYTIVNPRKLDWKLQIDVCQRCHLQGNAVLKPGKSFLDFRPGQKLADYIEVFMPKYEGAEDEFIMASHAQRLQMSKCFIASGETVATQKLTCITCHNPHVSVKVTGKEIFNQSCKSCHSAATNECKASNTARLNVADNCVSCHMPVSGTLDIPHVTVHDHKIQIPSTAKTTKHKTFAGIQCINEPNNEAVTKARAYLKYVESFDGEKHTLDSAEKYLSSHQSKNESEAYVHLLYLKKSYQQIVNVAQHIQPLEQTNAWYCYRIGQSYQHLQQFDRAKLWYAQAIALMPANTDFMVKWGTVHIQLGQLNQAIDILRKCVVENRNLPEAYTNLGFAYISKGDLYNAKVCYDKALQLDPDYEQALLNTAGWHLAKSNKTEAKNLLKKILKRNPENTQVKYLLEKI